MALIFDLDILRITIYICILSCVQYTSVLIAHCMGFKLSFGKTSRPTNKGKLSVRYNSIVLFYDEVKSQF